MMFSAGEERMKRKISDYKDEISRLHRVMLIMEAEGLTINEATALEKMRRIMDID